MTVKWTNDWEQRKFSDFAQRESLFQTSSYDCPSVEYEDVIVEEGCLNKDIRLKEVQKTGIKFDGTQVLYGKLRPYLHNWLNPDFMGVAVGDWWVLRPVEIDKNFLYRLIQTKKFDDVANQSSGSKMPRADWNLVSQSEFIVPTSLKEQCRIAEVFEGLDHLITLHQWKCYFYEIIRLNDWEQRKLGELADGFDYGLNAAATDFDGRNKYIRITDIDDETHLLKSDNLTSPDLDLSNADDYKLSEGDIVFARTGASVGKTYKYKAFDGRVYFAGFLIRAQIKQEYDTEFVFQNTLTDKYDRFIRITSQRSGQPGVNAQEYQNFDIMVPKLDEQKKIGEYFSNLDNLITLHQRKCTLYKNIKLDTETQRKFCKSKKNPK